MKIKDLQKCTTANLKFGKEKRARALREPRIVGVVALLNPERLRLIERLPSMEKSGCNYARSFLRTRPAIPNNPVASRLSVPGSGTSEQCVYPMNSCGP